MKSTPIVLVLVALMGLAAAQGESDSFSELPEGATCVPGSRWTKDCNWCHCTERGVGICTLRLCFAEKREVACESNSVWKADCNICRCTDGVGVCTKKACPVPIQPIASVDVPECEGEGRWRKDCNWCRCINGKGVCTRRGCPSGESDSFFELPKGATCVPGSRWTKDCNWCHCSEHGVGVCGTLRLCFGEEREVACERNSVWKADCNICRCTNGVGVCTKKACPVPIQPIASVDVPECEGEGRWRKNCNWCRCINGKGVCTRRGCPSDPTLFSGAHECEGTASWKLDCNDCTCGNGRALCTTKFCL